MNEVYIVQEYGDSGSYIKAVYRKEEDAKLEVERLSKEDAEKERLYDEWVDNYNASNIENDDDGNDPDTDFGYVYSYKQMKVL